jgi:two-component system CheB/CheR fusion protein
MRFSLRDLPIKRKLMLVILLASSVALLLMGGALVIYERATFRKVLRTNMSVLAQIIGSNSTGALAFDDPDNAREILSALLAEKQVKTAAIYDKNGQIFAWFPAEARSDQFPSRPGQTGYKFNRRELVMSEPILQQGTRLGTVYLQADLGAMYARIRVYGLLLLLVGICSTAAALAVSARLQRRIAEPILQLAHVAAGVSQHHDYSARATKAGQDEIGQLTDAFNEMLARIGDSSAALAAREEELRRANKEKDNFIAVLSHELRTPLTPALTAVEMLQEEPNLEPSARTALGMIRRNIEVEARLIDDLLDINRIAHGKLELRRHVVDVRALLEHALQNYCVGAAAQKSIKLSTEINATATHVFADSARLTQVFWNLLQNACKFTPEGGAIYVRAFNESRPISSNGEVPASSTEGAVVDLIVEIRDTGMGVSPETLPRIFDPFEQGTRSQNRAFGGLGLGLAVSRAIVEMHGGSIAASSEGKNKGATFTVRLHTIEPVAAGLPKQPVASAEQAPPRPMCVLVVEDHLDTAEGFARLLERAGHEVICARNIREAQKYALTTPGRNRLCPFDILISDLDLPDGSGRDLMRNLAARYPIRGIAISGHGMKEDVQESIAAGFSYHIIKPVNWQELKRAIQHIATELVRSEEQPHEAPELSEQSA